MPAKRSNLSIRPSVYNKIRDYCAANDLVVGRWVEQALNNALDEATSPRAEVFPCPNVHHRLNATNPETNFLPGNVHLFGNVLDPPSSSVVEV